MADGPYDSETGELIPRDRVSIPFANADLLYRMKKRAGREKDRGDIYFLEQLFAAQGRQAPEV